MERYLLDTNIIIQLWKEHPLALDLIDEQAGIEYLVLNDCIVELANGETDEFFPRMSKRYRNLLHHIINSQVSGDHDEKFNQLFKLNGASLNYIVGNKVSLTDYAQISLCQQYEDIILVTDDRKMLKNAERILQPTKYLNYDKFIERLRELEIIS